MNNEARILIVDDEVDVLDFIAYNFEKEGFKTFVAKDGIEAINLARREKPDLILLDITMPRLDGYSVAEHVRGYSELKGTLVVFLTAHNDEESELKGFTSGADDYITKPIKPKLLMSRVKALLRRKFEGYHPLEKIELGSLTIDKERRLVTLGNDEIIFAKKEFDLLTMLASRPGRVFPRQEILSKIWNEDALVGDRTIDVHIRKIRQKIGEQNIKTVKGVGYKFDV